MRSDAAGVLVIWNDIEDAAEAEFLNWHVREHIPERVGLPGFLRGQRYVAIQGRPKYFNFYEAVDAETFSSAPYRERLNNPTPWTRQVVAHFQNTARTICKRVAVAGSGDGPFVETLRLSAGGETELIGAVRDELLPALVQREGIVAAHLLQGIRAASAGDSAEKALRSGTDQVADWVILIEAVDARFLLSAGHVARIDTFLDGRAKKGWDRGVYQLQFALTQQDARAAKPATIRKWIHTNGRTS